MTTMGLTSAEVQKLLEQYGLNIIEEGKKTSLLIQFLRQFKDLMVIILIAASILAFFADEPVDASIILGIVFLNATIGFVQEFKAEKAVEALKKLLSPKARVIRDGREQLVETKHLVPGDFVVLNEGDKVSADAALIEENEIHCDEAILTGESVPLKKDIYKNKKLFMGTQVTRGNGIAMVTETGMHTEFGKIAALTSETKKDKSPLQKELNHIGLFVGKVTIVLSVILFLVGFFLQGRQFVDTLLFAVSVAVAAVPEGLPTTITVALALGVQRLARKNAIVKQLSSVETLGSTTVICSDKTGTLTKNEMTVQEMVIDGHSIRVHGVGYEPEGSFLIRHERVNHPEFFEYNKKDLPDLAFKKAALYNNLQLAIRTAVLCNKAKLTSANDQWKILGDPTEGALITLAEKAGFAVDNLYKKHKKIHEFPFDSVRKRMSVIAQGPGIKEKAVYVKGAPDALLNLCTHLLQEGKIIPLDEKEKQYILSHHERLANQALRTIGLAYKKLPDAGDNKSQKKYDQEEIEKDLIFLGIIGMADPPREDVKEAVNLTHKAGIRVFIVTGDHGLTAHAVAKQLGLTKSYGVNIVTGEMLHKMSDEKLMTYVAPGQETIFARVSPEHKLRIVEALKRSGEVVAVTGDGVNDAPALKRADIGVAMGITGTDVSKEAANMVLTDDSFSTIVTAIIEGRTIYENMKKFIFFIFSSNIGELIAIFGGIMVGLPAPLTAVLMLIINTLTDVFPALALGVEPVEKTILERPPRKPDSKIMERPFIRRYVLSGVVIGLVTIGTFIINLLWNRFTWGEPLALDSHLYMQSATMAFVVLTLLQMVQALNSRSATVSLFKMKFFENLHLIAAIIFSVVATILLVQLPMFSRYIKTTPLTLTQWLLLTAAAFTVLIFEEIRKLFTRRKKALLASS